MLAFFKENETSRKEDLRKIQISSQNTENENIFGQETLIN